MAARETFEWFVATLKNPNPTISKYIQEEREYLLTLRSEDEQRRFVDEVIEHLRTTMVTRTAT